MPRFFFNYLRGNKGYKMTKRLQIGNESFEYPVQGDGNWGEEATAWAEAVTDALAESVGPNDILPTSATLANNQATPADIPGLSFNTADVLSAIVTFIVEREATSTEVESGEFEINFDGTDWKSVQTGIGDTGVILSITAAGQVQYTSTDLTGHISSSIRFRAKTLDQP
jgi:hypothetical protein